MSGQTTSQRSRDNQAQIMATLGQPIEGTQVKTFPRFFALVATKPCCDPSEKNGHITPEMAIAHGKDLAVEILASLPADMDQEAKLAKVAVQVATKPRFQCTKGCTFGHKTQAQAQTCSDGSQVRQAKAVKNSIQVAPGTPTLAEIMASYTKAPKATPEAPKAPKLRSGSQGQTSKA